MRYLSKICGRHSLLPKSFLNPLRYDSGAVQYISKLAIVRKGWYNGQDIAAKTLRDLGSDSEQTKKVGATSHVLRRTDHIPQRFHEAVTIWKTLHHPNVLSLLGVTITRDQLTTVSEWMTNGSANEFTEAHPDANRLKLVCFPFGSLSFLMFILNDLHAACRCYQGVNLHA